MSEWIYFALDEPRGLVKIGRSSEVGSRLQALRYKFGSHINVIGVIRSRNRSDEPNLHKRFREHRRLDAGRGREWFSFHVSIKEFVESASQEPDLTISRSSVRISPLLLNKVRTLAAERGMFTTALLDRLILTGLKAEKTK